MTIPNVSLGELIDPTTFGNAVVDGVNGLTDATAALDTRVTAVESQAATNANELDTRGIMSSSVGPASDVDYPPTGGTICSVSHTFRTGRWYKVTINGVLMPGPGDQGKAARASIYVGGAVVAAKLSSINNSEPGCVTVVWAGPVASGTKSVEYRVSVDSGSNSVKYFGANGFRATMIVEDCGWI